MLRVFRLKGDFGGRRRWAVGVGGWNGVGKFCAVDGLACVWWRLGVYIVVDCVLPGSSSTRHLDKSNRMSFACNLTGVPRKSGHHLKLLWFEGQTFDMSLSVVHSGEHGVVHCIL
jgi:hypothetical protein